ncbi:MAG TPA: choice-of-anchor D domain-containing protein [Terriglobia bacterium]|nr:choice-of-anchor D domain-containing protein [Terriglobia bacterium]
MAVFAAFISEASAQTSARLRVTHDVHHDTSLALRDLPPAPPLRGHHFDELEQLPHANRAPSDRFDPVMQRSAGAPVSATVTESFEGLGEGQYGFSVAFMPPDTEGAAGATQYVQWVNTSFAVFDKQGNLLLGPLTGNTLWSGFGGACQTDNDGDPIVRFDQAAQRWVFSQLAGRSSPPTYQCVAVSTSADATGSYNRYAFQFSTTEIDYPKLAVWPDAYYVSSNQFDSNLNYLGPEACALDRSNMLLGNAATAVCFQASPSVGFFLPSDLDGATPPPGGSPDYFINFDPNTLDALDLWQFHVDFTTPANSTFTQTAVIPVAPFTPACASDPCIPQPGTSQQLDSLSDRVMYRLAYRHFPSGAESLVLNHSVGSPSGVRWYEIRNPGGTPNVYQQGTYAPDLTDRWMGSIAEDQSADIAVGYSISSSGIFPGIRFTGRVPSDSLNTLEDEATLVDGAGSQQGTQPPADERWGDYSAMTVDPADDCTFWYTSEYLPANGDFNWHTRITALKFPACGTTPVVNVSPVNLTFASQAVGTTSPPQTVTVTNVGESALGIIGITVEGSGFGQTNTCPASLAINASCTVSVTFMPTVMGAASADVAIQDNAPGEPQKIFLTGTGTEPLVSFSPTSLVFGQQPVGLASAPQAVTLTNTGNDTLTITTSATSGDFILQSNSCGTSVAAGASCAFNISFDPTATGTRTGALTVTDNAPGSPQSVALSGTGIQGTICTSPPSLAFASQVDETPSASQSVTLTNCGTAAVFITNISTSSGFTQTNTCPVSLIPSQQCAVSVVFDPVTVGAQNGQLTIVDSAGTQTCALSGTGTPNSTRTVDFDGDGKADLSVWRPGTGTWYVIPSGNPGTSLKQVQGLPGDVPVAGDFDGDGKADYAVWRPSTGTWYVIPSSNPGAPTTFQWGTPGDVPVPGDYDGDGKTDYAIWRPSNSTWYVIPSSNPSQSIVQAFGLPGDIPVPGDYDGDGKTDFAVWRPSTGTWYVMPSGSPGTTLTQQWGAPGDIPVLGDYDGDGKADYAVWRPSKTTFYVIPSSNPSQTVSQAWGQTGDVPVVGDFDGDHKNDYAVWRPSAGQWIILNSSSGTTTTTAWGACGDLPATRLAVTEQRHKHIANMDGDRKADVAVWRPSNGTWYVIPSSAPATSLKQPWGVSTDIPVPGDYDGDGKTDYAVWRPSNGTWYVIPSSAPSTSLKQQWGVSTDIPVPGDYDGDGKTDYAVWRPSNATFYVLLSSTGKTATQTLGQSGDIPVPGDYDGDGKTDYAVWRPSNGTFYVILSSTGKSVTQAWGAKGDVPVPGDYDGDGQTDYAVWRPSNGTFYVIPSSSPTKTISQQWGASGDIPVPKDYDGDEKTDYAFWRPSNGTWYIIPSSAPNTSITTPWGVSTDVPVNKPTGQ